MNVRWQDRVTLVAILTALAVGYSGIAVLPALAEALIDYRDYFLTAVMVATVIGFLGLRHFSKS